MREGVNIDLLHISLLEVLREQTGDYPQNCVTEDNENNALWSQYRLGQDFFFFKSRLVAHKKKDKRKRKYKYNK